MSATQPLLCPHCGTLTTLPRKSAGRPTCGACGLSLALVPRPAAPAPAPVPAPEPVVANVWETLEKPGAVVALPVRRQQPRGCWGMSSVVLGGLGLALLNLVIWSAVAYGPQIVSDVIGSMLSAAPSGKNLGETIIIVFFGVILIVLAVAVLVAVLIAMLIAAVIPVVVGLVFAIVGVVQGKERNPDYGWSLTGLIVNGLLLAAVLAGILAFLVQNA